MDATQSIHTSNRVCLSVIRLALVHAPEFFIVAPRMTEGPVRMPELRPRIIETERDIAAGVQALCRKCVVMRRLHDVAGPPPLRRQPAGLEGLARIIVAQQLSVASATAIWKRLETTVAPLTAERMLATTDEALRAAGLSRPKVRTLRAVAHHVDQGLDLDGLGGLSEEEVHAALCAIPGVGPWTADIFLMFCLGRADAFAGGDLALQIAAQQAFALSERPRAGDLIELSQRWRPWRGVAARLLWAYYAVLKERRAGIPV